MKGRLFRPSAAPERASEAWVEDRADGNCVAEMRPDMTPVSTGEKSIVMPDPASTFWTTTQEVDPGSRPG
jgi:hypothetical protein